MYTKPFLLLALLFLLAGCAGGGKQAAGLDTYSSGHIHIAVDATVQPLLEAELAEFQAQYKNAHISADYTSETDAVQQLLNDSARLIVVSRQLTADETQVLARQQFKPRYTKVAYDAVALIVNLQQDSTLQLNYEQLQGMLQGRYTSWMQLKGKPAGQDSIHVVVDDPGASTVRLIEDSLIGPGKPLPGNLYTLHSSQQVVDYVATHKHALGLIGLSWVSDMDDSLANTFLAKVRVVPVARKNTHDFVQPLQYYILKRRYPFMRELTIVSREARVGLGSGFTSFMAGERGQRIVLKADLVPAIAPIRLIEFKKQKIR